MKLRSLLFVPGDRPDRMEKACASGADVVIIDLEDSVADLRKQVARTETAGFLRNSDRPTRLFVRINWPLPAAEADLAAVINAAPDGIVLPKSAGGVDVERLDALLSGHEAIRILPIATETPASIFGLGTYGGSSARLVGLTWGAEDLPAAIGASSSREPDGSFTAPYQLARSLTLFGAHAAAVPAIETVYPNIRDTEGLAAYAARGRRDGFSGMLAIHPAQIPVIHAAFSPTHTEITHAQEVVAAFDANPGVGAFQLNGKMIDGPHLKQALAVLRQAGIEPIFGQVSDLSI
jgi:citrate lyase subunit beta/citryl-CoA lyase